MSQGRVAVEGVRIRFHVAHTFYKPDRCIPVARSTTGTGQCKRPQSDRSGRKGFIRNLFDSAANGIAITVEHHGMGNQTRDSDVSARRHNYFQWVFSTSEGSSVHLSATD